MMMMLITKLESIPEISNKEECSSIPHGTLLLVRVCSISLQSPLLTVMAENAYTESTSKAETSIQAHILNPSA